MSYGRLRHAGPLQYQLGKEAQTGWFGSVLGEEGERQLEDMSELDQGTHPIGIP